MEYNEEDMSPELTPEEVEEIRRTHPVNTMEHVKRVRRLLKHARPGNLAWRTLENEYGYQGDYSAADEGEAPQGARW